MKNVIVSCYYKPPNANWKIDFYHMQKILTNASIENKIYFATGYYNLT